MKVEHQKPQREQIFLFKDTNQQEVFKKNTTETEDFTKCINDKNNLSNSISNWMNVLNKHCKKAFKIHRVREHIKTKHVDKALNELIEHRNILKEGNTESPEVKKI